MSQRGTRSTGVREHQERATCPASHSACCRPRDMRSGRSTWFGDNLYMFCTDGHPEAVDYQDQEFGTLRVVKSNRAALLRVGPENRRPALPGRRRVPQRRTASRRYGSGRGTNYDVTPQAGLKTCATPVPRAEGGGRERRLGSCPSSTRCRQAPTGDPQAETESSLIHDGGRRSAYRSRRAD